MTTVGTASSVNLRAWIAIGCVASLVIGVAVGLPSSLDGTTFNPLLEENGPVEVFSAVGYVLCVGAILLLGRGRAMSKGALAVIILLLAMGARELDFHNRFWTHSISRADYYFDGSVPVPERLLAVASIAILAAAVIYLALRFIRALVAGLLALDPFHVAIGLGIGSVALSKLIDGIGNRLSRFGYEMDMSTVFMFEKFEEVIESGIWMYFMIAIITYYMLRRGGESSGGA